VIDCYVLDGPRALYFKGDSYGAIAESYAEFTVRNYGLATVVFDDENGAGASIKDNIHQGRRRTCT
jgi:hypothetical protein